MLKIYGRPNSINVRKVLWMADEIGLAYTREDWGRGFRSTSEPEFLKVNPLGLVPVIDDGGFILRESNAIVRYLASKHGRSDLYPTDVRERARIESWMDWCISDLNNAIRPVFFALVVKSPAHQEPKSLEAGIGEWSRQMAVLDQHLASGGPYVMGGSFTIADIPVGLAVNRWFSIDFEKPAFPAIAAYYDVLAKRPAYRSHGRNGTP
jgi:glutathione S-transferase